MQGVVFDIKRFAVHDGPGIRTTVFLKGCPLKCFWCHNPEGLEKSPIESVRKITMDGKQFDHSEMAGLTMSVYDVMDTIKKDRMFMEESNGGVTFSGGEPTTQPEFLLCLLKACHEEGIHTAVDTCGLASQAIFIQILPYVDLFLFDLKHHNPETHRKGTGHSNKTILENLILLLQYRKKIRIRIPVVPGFNYNEADLKGMIELLKSTKGSFDQIDLLPFHNIAKNKYKRFGFLNPMEGIASLKKEELFSNAELFEKEGYKVKIGG
jgi:pyruvate formate lyase activating enzyme